MNKKNSKDFEQYDEDTLRLINLKREIKMLKKAKAEAEHKTLDKEYKYKLLKEAGLGLERNRKEIKKARASIRVTDDFGTKTIVYEFRQYLVINGYLNGAMQYFEKDIVKPEDIMDAPSSEYSKILVIVDASKIEFDVFVAEYKDFPYAFDVIYIADIENSDLNFYAEKLSQMKKLRKAMLGRVDFTNSKLIEELKSYDIVISGNFITDVSIWRKLMAIMNNLTEISAVLYADHIWTRGAIFDSEVTARLIKDNSMGFFKEKCMVYAEYKDGCFVVQRSENMDEFEKLEKAEKEGRKDLYIERLEREMKTLKNENNALRVANKAIKESYSWKITKPVRDIGSIMINIQGKKSNKK